MEEGREGRRGGGEGGKGGKEGGRREGGGEGGRVGVRRHRYFLGVKHHGAREMTTISCDEDLLTSVCQQGGGFSHNTS